MANLFALTAPPSMAPAAPPAGVVDHPVYGQVRYTVEQLSDDPDEQVAQTIRRMQTLAVTDASSPEIQRDLAEIREGIGRTGNDLVEGIYWWVKSRLRFQQDSVTGGPVWALGALGEDGVIAESLIRPVDMSSLPAGAKVGDCDDYSMYVASLLEAARIPWAFVTVAASSRDPEVYSHVYVAAYPDGMRVPLDASHGPAPGWEASQGYPVWRQTEWSRWSMVPWWLWLLLGAALLTPGAADEMAVLGTVR